MPSSSWRGTTLYETGCSGPDREQTAHRLQMDVLCTAAGVGAHVGEHGAVQDDPHERRQPEGRRPCSNGADEAQQVAEEWLHVQREYVSRVGACQPRRAMQRPTPAQLCKGCRRQGASMLPSPHALQPGPCPDQTLVTQQGFSLVGAPA